MESNRIRTLDVVKGVIIVAIVFTHVFICQDSTNTPGTSSVLSSKQIVMLTGYMCLMMFFMVSGYFYNPERSSKENIIKRLKILGIALVVCFTVLPLILMCFLTLLGHPCQIDWYFSVVAEIFGHDQMFQPYGANMSPNWILWVCSGYYFIQAMLIAFIIFYLSVNYVKDDWRKLLAAIFILVTVSALIRQFCYRPPLFLDIAPISCAFMFVGLAAKKYGIVEKFDNWGWTKKKNLLVVIIAVIAIYLLITTCTPKMNFHNTVYGNFDGWSAYPFFIEGVLCSFVGFIIISMVAKIPHLSDMFTIIGRHTLAILMLHMFLMKMAIAPFMTMSMNDTLPAMPTYVALILATFAIVVSVFIATAGKDVAIRFYNGIKAKNQ